MSTDKSIRIFVVFVSGLLILYGLFKVMQIGLFLNNSASTKGKVIGSTVVEEFHDGLKTYYYPKVSFINKETGEEVIGESIFSSKRGNSDVGETVSIYYDKDNPSQLIIHSFIDVWYTPVASILGGIFIILVYRISLFLNNKVNNDKH